MGAAASVGAAPGRTRRAGSSTPWPPGGPGMPLPPPGAWVCGGHRQSGCGVGAAWGGVWAAWGGDGGPGCRPRQALERRPPSATRWSQSTGHQEARYWAPDEGRECRARAGGLGLSLGGRVRGSGARASGWVLVRLCALGLSGQSCVSDAVESVRGPGLRPVVRVLREPGHESAFGGLRKVGATTHVAELRSKLRETVPWSKQAPGEPQVCLAPHLYTSG